MNFRKTMLALPLLVAMPLVGCDQTDANVASRNLSTAADNFEIMRRVVFYNSINGEYLLEIVGLCSLGNTDTPLRMSVTCKTGANDYKKHFLGLGANVTFFAEQINSAKASTHFYRVTFKPSTILPAVEIR